MFEVEGYASIDNSKVSGIIKIPYSYEGAGVGIIDSYLPEIEINAEKVSLRNCDGKRVKLFGSRTSIQNTAVKDITDLTINNRTTSQFPSPNTFYFTSSDSTLKGVSVDMDYNVNLDRVSANGSTFLATMGSIQSFCKSFSIETILGPYNEGGICSMRE